MSYADRTIGFYEAAKVSFAGLFLAYWMPLSVVGDGARVVWLKRNASDNYGKAIWIVLLDRLVALAALLFFLVPFVPLYVNRFYEKASGMVGLAAGLCILLLATWWFLRSPLFDRLRNAIKVSRQWATGRRHYVGHIVVGISYVVSYFLLLEITSYALNADVGALQLFAYAPLLFLAQNFPISFGGLGSRELAFLIILGDIVGKPMAVAMALIVGVSFVLASLPGGLFIGMLGKGNK